MSEKENKAIEICKKFVEENKTRPIVLHEAIETILNLIEKLQAESEKKEKMIDEMAKTIKGIKSGAKYCNVFKTPPCKKDKTYPCDKCIKQYFERQVETDE